MEETKILRIERSTSEATYIEFVGTARALADMVADWIHEDLSRIPFENGRLCMDDPEFMDALYMYDRLCEVSFKEDNEIYRLSYVDGEGFVNGALECAEWREE